MDNTNVNDLYKLISFVIMLLYIHSEVHFFILSKFKIFFWKIFDTNLLRNTAMLNSVFCFMLRYSNRTENVEKREA
jgi:hypothetical protein